MPLTPQRTVSIILEQCGEAEERCPGYRRELVNLIGEILTLERQNRVSRISIQKKINEKFNATGRFLWRRTRDTDMAEPKS